MFCKPCNQSGILNTAGGKEFYVCTSCKQELTLEEPPKDLPGLGDFKLDPWLPSSDNAEGVPGEISLDDIAKWFGVDVKDLKDLKYVGYDVSRDCRVHTVARKVPGTAVYLRNRVFSSILPSKIIGDGWLP